MNERQKFSRLVRFLPIFFLTFILIHFHRGFAQDSSLYKPEAILEFADHLYQESDYFRAITEYERFLFMEPGYPYADTIRYRIGLCHQKRKRYALSNEIFEKLIHKYPSSDFLEAARYQIGLNYYFDDNYDNSIDHLLNNRSFIQSDFIVSKWHYLLGWNYLYRLQWGKAETEFDTISRQFPARRWAAIAGQIREHAHQGYSLPARNPWLAGFLSTIIPGAGKMYADRFGDGLYSLIVIGTTSAVAFYSYQHDYQSRAWGFGAFAVALHVGNIYGSIVQAKLYNIEKQEALLQRIISNFEQPR